MFDSLTDAKIEQNIGCTETVFVPPEKAYLKKEGLKFDSTGKCLVYEDSY